MKPDVQKSDNWLVCIVLAIGNGSYLVRRAVAHPLFGPCGPLLSLARPLLTAIRAEEICKGHSQLGFLVSLARYPPALFSMKSISPDGFFGIQILQNSIRQGLCSGPRWRCLRRSLGPLVGWGKGYSLPIPHLHRPFASRLKCDWPQWPTHFSDASTAYGAVAGDYTCSRLVLMGDFTFWISLSLSLSLRPNIGLSRT